MLQEKESKGYLDRNGEEGDREVQVMMIVGKERRALESTLLPFLSLLLLLFFGG